MWRMPSVLTFPPVITDDMSKEEEEKMYSIWVNWEKRIISFEKEEGFHELQYKTHDEMFLFAIERGNEGFGIQ